MYAFDASVSINAAGMLRLEDSIAVEGVKRFVAKDHFVYPRWWSKDVRICFLEDAFKAQFLPKVEEDVPALNLKYYILTEKAPDSHIKKYLRQEPQIYATTLSDIWSLLQKQPDGEDGPLTTKEDACNVFYVYDKDGALWGVRVTWIEPYLPSLRERLCRKGGWNIGAWNIDAPNYRGYCSRIFLRSS